MIQVAIRLIHMLVDKKNTCEIYIYIGNKIFKSQKIYTFYKPMSAAATNVFTCPLLLLYLQAVVSLSYVMCYVMENRFTHLVSRTPYIYLYICVCVYIHIYCI